MRTGNIGENIVTIQRAVLGGILFGLLASVAMVSPGMTQTGTYEIEVSWARPTVGTNPVMYHVWVRSREGDAEVFGDWEKWESTPNLSQVLTYNTGSCYEVRVQAEDSNGRFGPYSTPSLEYCGEVIDENSGPGRPGTPIRDE